MSKYIHVSEEDGKITVKDGQTTGYLGWIHKVPNNYVLRLSLDDIDGRVSISELLDQDERAVLIYTNG